MPLRHPIRCRSLRRGHADWTEEKAVTHILTAFIKEGETAPIRSGVNSQFERVDSWRSLRINDQIELRRARSAQGGIRFRPGLFIFPEDVHKNVVLW